MAPAHVPGEQLPLQGQSMYNSPYQSIYPVDQYDAQSWNSQLQHAALVPDNPATPSWHHNTYTTQQYNQISSPYVNQGQTHRTTSPYQYGQFGNHPAPANYGHATSVDPSLGVTTNALRQQQHSPYQLAAQATPPQSRPSTVAPQSLQHALSAPVQDPRATASYQVSKTRISRLNPIINKSASSLSLLLSLSSSGLSMLHFLNLCPYLSTSFQRVKLLAGSTFLIRRR